MFDPKTVLTEEGVDELNVHIHNMKEAIFFLTNNADDLHIGHIDDRQISLLYELEKMLPTYKQGDGEQ